MNTSIKTEKELFYKKHSINADEHPIDFAFYLYQKHQEKIDQFHSYIKLLPQNEFISTSALSAAVERLRDA